MGEPAGPAVKRDFRFTYDAKLLKASSTDLCIARFIKNYFFKKRAYSLVYSEDIKLGEKRVLGQSEEE